MLLDCPPHQPIMPEVTVKKGEPIDRALKRLKSKLDSEGIMDEIRRLRSFETPTEKRRRKARATAKRGRIRFRFINEESKHNKPKGDEAGAATEARAGVA